MSVIAHCESTHASMAGACAATWTPGAARAHFLLFSLGTAPLSGLDPSQRLRNGPDMLLDQVSAQTVDSGPISAIFDDLGRDRHLELDLDQARDWPGGLGNRPGTGRRPWLEALAGGPGPRPILFFFQAEDGIRDAQESRGLGDVYKRQS